MLITLNASAELHLRVFLDREAARQCEVFVDLVWSAISKASQGSILSQCGRGKDVGIEQAREEPSLAERGWYGAARRRVGAIIIAAEDRAAAVQVVIAPNIRERACRADSVGRYRGEGAVVVAFQVGGSPVPYREGTAGLHGGDGRDFPVVGNGRQQTTLFHRVRRPGDRCRETLRSIEHRMTTFATQAVDFLCPFGRLGAVGELAGLGI